MSRVAFVVSGLCFCGMDIGVDGLVALLSLTRWGCGLRPGGVPLDFDRDEVSEEPADPNPLQVPFPEDSVEEEAGEGTEDRVGDGEAQVHAVTHS